MCGKRVLRLKRWLELVCGGETKQEKTTLLWAVCFGNHPSYVCRFQSLIHSILCQNTIIILTFLFLTNLFHCFEAKRIKLSVNFYKNYIPTTISRIIGWFISIPHHDKYPYKLKLTQKNNIYHFSTLSAHFTYAFEETFKHVMLWYQCLDILKYHMTLNYCIENWKMILLYGVIHSDRFKNKYI